MLWHQIIKITEPTLFHQLASILGIEVEGFFFTDDRPKLNGPAGRARKSFETISSLPRNRQKQILDVIDVLMRKEAAEVD